MNEPQSIEELRELADLLDDLQTHKGWHATVAMAQKMFGATMTVERITTAVASHTTPEAIALLTVDIIAGRKAAQQLIELPATLAKKYRDVAAKHDAGLRAHVKPGLGPDVELTQ